VIEPDCKKPDAGKHQKEISMDDVTDEQQALDEGDISLESLVKDLRRRERHKSGRPGSSVNPRPEHATMKQQSEEGSKAMGPSESTVRKHAKSQGYRLRKNSTWCTFKVIQLDTGLVLEALQDPGVMIEEKPGVWIDPGSGDPYLAWGEDSEIAGVGLSLDEVNRFLETGETKWGGFRLNQSQN
jgi:hypothetical protein